jgi:hypothetical protein
MKYDGRLPGIHDTCLMLFDEHQWYGVHIILALIILLAVQICDAVAVAGLLNATLVIPMFHLNSVWRDSRYLFMLCLLLKFVT